MAPATPDARSESTADPKALPRTTTVVPPLLPVLLPLVVAAIMFGVLFTWLFPPAAPGNAMPVPRFTDVTAESGLAGAPVPAAAADAPTTLGGGVVCFDYDSDGRIDLFFVHGSAWPWEESLAKRATRPSCSLWHNDGQGHFTDVTSAAGLDVELQGMSAAAGDFDNDGRPDLYVACVGTNHLFRNRGAGRFEDVTEQAGVGGEDNTWSTGATWMDYDNDGKLDLIVAHYAQWPREVDLQTAFTVSAVGRSYGSPSGFLGAFPSVYRNNGDGRFSLVANSAGLRDVDPQTRFPVAKALAVVPVDFNGDGRLDLLFTYHTSESALFLNQGDGTFRRWTPARDYRSEGISAGLTAASSLPLAQGGEDARATVLRTWLAQAAARHPGNYVHLSEKLGVAVLDYELDGRVELFSGNGRAEPDTNQFGETRDFEAVPELLWRHGSEWKAAVPAAPDSWAQPLVARGVAVADFDGDGDSDVVIAQNGGPPRLLRNDQRGGLPWLQVELVATRGPRGAGGARVEVYTPRRVLAQTMAPAMSFMAQSASTLTFGLGEDARVRRLVVRWPDGVRQEVRPVTVNRRLVLTEP